ncbi:uncharacterized protein EKO05_0002592 [Ascochyta rabiei]|uniref:uncharacterized protein n=1 Tax=Didymella rabiei TaxID=5454 RepID=UPI0021FC681C|nr:uncharacterized protein EKO05_0002592 [Ascochyta rabiei]UPX12014.1 hypothetical protein EKO05_0002592 [Ascochyta rabiei]
MASFESHPLFSYLKYQPAHALLLIQSGARCRVCAVLYDGNNKQLGWGGSFCTAHMPDETWFSDFIQACCRMQDGLKQFCKQIPPPSTVRPWAPLFGMTASELWWWEMLNVFQLKCEISLVKLSAWWETLLEEGWCSSEILFSHPGQRRVCLHVSSARWSHRRDLGDQDCSACLLALLALRLCDPPGL